MCMQDMAHLSIEDGWIANKLVPPQIFAGDGDYDGDGDDDDSQYAGDGDNI